MLVLVKVFVKRSLNWCWVQFDFNPTYCTNIKYKLINFPVTEHASPQLWGNRSDLTTFSYTKSFNTFSVDMNVINTFHGQTEWNLKWSWVFSQTPAQKIKVHLRNMNTKLIIYWKQNVTLMKSYAVPRETRCKYVVGYDPLPPTHILWHQTSHSESKYEFHTLFQL